MRSATTEKPSEVSEIQHNPKGKQGQIVPPAGAHGRQKAPQGEASQTQPKQNPVKGEEAEKAQRGGRHKPSDLWGIDRVEINVLDLRANQSAFAERLI